MATSPILLQRMNAQDDELCVRGKGSFVVVEGKQAMAKTFLALVGIMYLGLALWCSFSPAQTSQVVGFELIPGPGDSEFLAIYGGLEFGMALLFLAPLVRPDCLKHALWACLLLHLGLVLFRTIGFFQFGWIGGTTMKLAAGEWVILLLAAWFASRES